MAAALSDTEFHRMQLQLIELRTKNYELEGKSKQLDRELASALEKTGVLEKDLNRARQAINKSKKAKDVEATMMESDSLQRKLLSQEEEFRLQNQTLMGELTLLVSTNESMTKELETFQEDKASGNKGLNSQESSDEWRRLQAENAALQKNLQSLQEQLDQQSWADGGGLGTAEDAEGNSQGMGDSTDSQAAEVSPSTSPVAKAAILKATENSESANKLRLELDTEREEKKILKEQLTASEAQSKEQIASLQDELEKMTDKWKKKQESFMQVQSEKEALFKESRAKQGEAQAARDRDQKYYKDLITKLQAEVSKGKEEVANHQSSADKQTENLKRTLTELQNQAEATKMVAGHQLHEQDMKHQTVMTALKEDLNRAVHQRDDLTVQLQASQQAASEATEQLHEANAERDRQIAAWQEVSKVAEKRKSLLDELAIKYQKEYDSHRENVAALEKKDTDEIDHLNSLIEEKTQKVAELSKQLHVVDELGSKVRSYEDAKGWLERRLKEVEEELENTRQSHQAEKAEMSSQHQEEKEGLVSKHLEETAALTQTKRDLGEEFKGKEAELQGQIKELNNTTAGLKQEIEDQVNDKKIHEKKGLTMLKDLKRQLNAEKKRAKKLETRLQEVLLDNPGKGVEELFKHSDSNDFLSGDTSSISSWGAGASGLGKDSIASGPQSPMSGNNSFVSESSVGEEYSDLLRRVATLQQQKWMLEEKVNYLEMSNGCMAEDLLNKTSIIEHYVMDSRSGRKQSNPGEDKLSLKKVMEMVKNTDQTQQTQDMNRKLQSMLEETLTKNMHLQKDLELISQEVVRLSKLSVAAMVPASSKVSTSKPEVAVPTSLPLKASIADAGLSVSSGDDVESLPSADSSSLSGSHFEVVSSTEVEAKGLPNGDIDNDQPQPEPTTKAATVEEVES